jgi:hypothetical protein
VCCPVAVTNITIQRFRSAFHFRVCTLGSSFECDWLCVKGPDEYAVVAVPSGLQVADVVSHHLGDEVADHQLHA